MTEGKLTIGIWVRLNNEHLVNPLFNKKQLLDLNQPCFFSIFFYRFKNQSESYRGNKSYSLRYDNNGKVIIKNIDPATIRDGDNVIEKNFNLNDYEKSLLLLEKV